MLNINQLIFMQIFKILLFLSLIDQNPNFIGSGGFGPTKGGGGGGGALVRGGFCPPQVVQGGLLSGGAYVLH